MVGYTDSTLQSAGGHRPKSLPIQCAWSMVVFHRNAVPKISHPDDGILLRSSHTINMVSDGSPELAEPVAGSEDIIKNPVTDERIKFLDERTPEGDEVLRFEFWGKPHNVGPGAHVHPKQEEYFEVLDGILSAHVGKKDITLGKGDSMTVPPGTPHTWWNSSDHELHGYVELRPSLDMHDEFEALFALGRAGKTDEHGIPNLLQTAVLLDRYPDTIYKAGVPIILQKFGIKMLAPIGRLLGYKVRYPELLGRPVGSEQSEPR